MNYFVMPQIIPIQNIDMACGINTSAGADLFTDQ